jgi:hypothetical protein
MVLTGEVKEVSAASGPDGRGTVTVALVGRNSLGNHVTGTVRLSLPSGKRGDVEPT